MKYRQLAFGGKVKKPTDLENSLGVNALNQVGTGMAASSPTGGLITQGGEFVSSLLNTDTKGGAVGAGAIKYGAMGTEIGSKFGPVGAAVGAGAGLLTGAAMGSVNFEQEQKMKEKEKIEGYNRSLKQGEANYAANISAGFNTNGVGRIGYYGFGGVIANRDVDYKAEGGEVVSHSPNNQPAAVASQGEINPLSSTTSKIEGDSHNAASGGVGMAGGDYIFSDRLLVSQPEIAALKQYNINAKPTDTFASVVEKIGKAEQEAEMKSKSSNNAEKNTGLKMLERFSNVKAMLAEAQEALNPTTNPDAGMEVAEEMPIEMPMAAMGGAVKSYAMGGPLKPLSLLGEYANMNEEGFNNPGSGTNYNKPFNPLADAMNVNAVTKQAPYNVNAPYSPDYVAPSTNGLNNFSSSVMANLRGLMNKNKTTDGKVYTTETEQKASALPYLANGLQYASNANKIANLPLTQNEYPTRSFVGMDTTDRASGARFGIDSMVANAIDKTTGVNNTTNNAVRARMLAQGLNSRNQVEAQELSRQDNIRNTNLGRFDNVDAYNTQQRNAREADLQRNTVFQTGQEIQNRNALTKGIIGQKEQDELMALSKEQTRLISEQYDSGVGARNTVTAGILAKAGVTNEMLAKMDEKSKKKLFQDLGLTQ